jgi:thiamine-phosphate pyrophosphorylase
MRSAEAPRGVYLLTPDWDDTARLLAATAAALEGGVRWLQYRNKRADAAMRRAQALALRELTRTHGAKLVVNDDVDLAIAASADGVHVGRDDPDPRPRLARAGVAMAIGVSCYDELQRARDAVAAGADYVAFGSVFASPTKPAAVRAPLALLAQARAAGMHVVAIGGIGADNIAQVAAAGAHAAALITAVYDAADPGTAARTLISNFNSGQHAYESQRTAV